MLHGGLTGWSGNNGSKHRADSEPGRHFAFAARFAQNMPPLCVIDPAFGFDAIFSPLEGLRLRPASPAVIRASPIKVTA